MKITINNRIFNSIPSATILEIARMNNIDIPALCYHPDLKIKGNCRMCLIEITGKHGLYTACSIKAEPGMSIKTDSKNINKSRALNLELIFGQHRVECTDCVLEHKCELLRLAKIYNVDVNKFKNRKAKFKKYKFGPSIEFDASKCIDCKNCIEVCQDQEVNYYETQTINNLSRVMPTCNKNIDCIYCGQCITHCPVGAIEAIGEFEDSEKALIKNKKITVFQFAPSIRASIGEEFGLPAGKIVTNQLVAAIKELGADKVFDVSLGADFTTIEEANELIERLAENKNLPMFTSCCPSWVKYIEFYYPEFIPNLTTVRSPHIISGGLIKTYLANQEKINPKNIYVVSIMPCTAKKYEIERPQVKINTYKPVDHVLTTRELAYLLKKKNINLAKIKGKEADNPFSEYSGAGVIYGASGGVMESALRTAYAKICSCKAPKIEFTQVRGLQGLKTAKIKIKNKTLKVAVTSGMFEAKKILEELKKHPKAYDYIEFMACTGGCIGGGGQPMPVNSTIRKARAKGLYSIDTKKKVRRAHDNKITKKMYDSFLTNKHLIHKICHTSFNKKVRETKIIKK